MFQWINKRVRGGVSKGVGLSFTMSVNDTIGRVKEIRWSSEAYDLGDSI